MDKIKLFGLLLVLLAIPAGVYLVRSSRSTRVETRAARIEEALIFTMPAEFYLKLGETADVAVKIDTGKETVTGVKIVLDFDPDLLVLAGDIKAGPAFDEFVAGEDFGQIVLKGKGQLIGQGTIATLSFKSIEIGETDLKVNSSSLVWDKSEKNNLFRKGVGSRILIE
ncbi:MAG TPA: cohesin domain-containing protein [Candidatus Bathyarchaeia archaeon]|nr:cohesin domain-containing protein [Candidatus Bathyarchaeia archaeon]